MKVFFNNYLAGLTLLLSGATLNAQNQNKPNLVFLFADQLRSDALGFTGNSKAQTPNIDKFSGQAVCFNNAVSVTPVCAPYRASLLTGKYTSSTGMVINELNMNPNHKTIAHVLTESGYSTGYVGKVHLNDQHNRSFPKGPQRLGFDDFWAGYSFNHQSFKGFYYTDDEGGKEIKVDLTGKYEPEVTTGLALDYLKIQAKKNKPFALFLSWNPPHDPWVKSNVLSQCYAKFKKTKFKLPANFKSLPDKYMDRFPQEFLKGDSAWKDEFITGDGYQEVMRCYYAMVNSVDEQFGRVMSTLDSLGIAENTIVVLTTDHGEMFTSQGRIFKLTFYNEAAQVPFLIKYPKVHTHGTSDICINTPDIAPTLLGLMGLKHKIPEQMEGNDLSFVLRNEKGKEPPFAFLQGMGHTYKWLDGYEWRAVRDKRFTYAKYLRDGAEFLFDRQKDRFEKVNVATVKGYLSVLGKLRAEMSKKMEELKDEFHPCSWYRDHWMYKEFSIKAAASGEFGPLSPIEPFRKK